MRSAWLSNINQVKPANSDCFASQNRQFHAAMHEEKNSRLIQVDASSRNRDNETIASDLPPEVQDLHVSTQKLLWKLDTRCAITIIFLHFHNTDLTNRILPLFILLVLCSFLDRTNVGNAKLYHLEADLHMTNAQFNQALTAFYPLYIAGQVTSISRNRFVHAKSDFAKGDTK